MIRAVAAAILLVVAGTAVALDRGPPAQRTGPLIITGTGSTGDVSGMSVPLLGGASGALGRVLPTLDIARAEIGNQVIPLRAFVASGFAASGDAGSGARYIRGTSAGPMAVQDAAGTWWQLDLSAPTVSAGWFGLLPSNTAAQNDGAAAKAVAALGAKGGGILTFPCGNFQFANGVDNNVQGVLFRGPPAPNGGRDAGASTTCARFIATQAGSTLFKHRTPYGQGYSKFVGGGIEDIELNGNNVAARVLEVDTVNSGSYRAFVTGAIGREAVWFHSGTSRTDVADAADVQSARIILACRQIDGAAQQSTDCYRLDGGVNSNFSFNEDVTLRCQFANGNCVTGINADNNRINLNAYRAGGSGRAVYGYAANSSTGSVGFDNNFFSHFSSNAPSYAQGMADTGATAPVKNEIAFLDTANSTPVPTAGTRSVWVGDFLQTYTPTVRCSAGTSTTGASLKGAYINRLNAISLYLGISSLSAACSGSLYLTLPQKAVPTATATALLIDRANGVPMYGVISPGSTEVQIAPISGGSTAASAVVEGGVTYLYAP